VEAGVEGEIVAVLRQVTRRSPLRRMEGDVDFARGKSIQAANEFAIRKEADRRERKDPVGGAAIHAMRCRMSEQPLPGIAVQRGGTRRRLVTAASSMQVDLPRPDPPLRPLQRDARSPASSAVIPTALAFDRYASAANDHGGFHSQRENQRESALTGHYQGPLV
jgi:hypothetical protein